MSELEIRVTYDHEGCFARIYSGDTLLASAYTYAYAGWIDAKTRAVAAVKEKHAALSTFGERPEPETITLR